MNDKLPFAVFSLKESSPQFFGRVVLITALAAERDEIPKILLSESYLLLERHKPHLHRRQVSVRPQTLPEVGVNTDEKFMQQAAYQVGQACLAEIVRAQFNTSGEMALFSAPYAFDPIPHWFVGLYRGLGLWHKELAVIMNRTSCPALSSFLNYITVIDVHVEAPTKE